MRDWNSIPPETRATLDAMARLLARRAAKRHHNLMTTIPNEHVPADVLTALKSWAASKPEIARLYVFGSRVTGINKDGGPVCQESDLDVAVVLSADVPDRTVFWMFDAKHWRNELAALIPYEVHLELMEPDTPVLQGYVNRTGVLLLNRP